MANLLLKNGIDWPDGTKQDTAMYLGGNSRLYTYNATTTAPPASGGIRMNHAADFTLVTEIYLDDDDATGGSAVNLPLAFPVGSTISVFDTRSSTGWAIFEITGTPTYSGSYYTIPVDLIAGGSFSFSTAAKRTGVSFDRSPTATGGSDWSVVSKTGAYTAAVGEFVLANVSSGSFNVTLPTAVGNSGKRIGVKKINQTGNYVNVNTTSSQTIDGLLNLRILVTAQAVVFISDGSNWRIEGRFQVPQYHVRAFGAKGDGSTDDRAAIQAAIDAIPKSGDTGTINIGGIVVFDNAEYNVDSPGLVIEDKCVWLIGEGGARSRAESSFSNSPYFGAVLKTAAASMTLITARASTGVLQQGFATRNLTLVDHNTPYSSTLMSVEHVNCWNVRDTNFRGARYGLVTRSCKFSGSVNVAVPTLNATTAVAGGSLTSGQLYRVCITANNASAETSQSNEQTRTPSGGNLSIGLSWSSVTNATGYRIYVAVGTNGCWQYVGTTASTSYTITSMSTAVNLSPPLDNETAPTLTDTDCAWAQVENAIFSDNCDAVHIYSSRSINFRGGLVNGGSNQMGVRICLKGQQIVLSDQFYIVGAKGIVCEGSLCTFRDVSLEDCLPMVEFYHSNRPRAGVQDSNGAANNLIDGYQLTATTTYGTNPFGVWMHVDAGKTAYSNIVGMGTITGCVTEVIDDSAGCFATTPSYWRIGWSGAKIGVFGKAPVVRTGAYTQTYSTATRTHSNPTATALTDSSGGTADGTVAAAGASYNGTTQSNINNNFAEFATRINQLITDLANTKQLLNSVIDDQQSYGWFQ